MTPPPVSLSEPASDAAVVELERADSRFRALLEAQAEAIVIVDGDGLIVMVNGQTERLFGYARAELLGRHVEMLMPAGVRERHVGHRRGYAHDPHVRTRLMAAGLDLYARRKDGSEFPVEVSLGRLVTESGVLITSTICDITTRKRAEADLEAAEERFRLAFEHAPIGMAIVAPDGRFMRVNRALCEMTGYPRRALLRYTLDDITHPDDIELDREQVGSLLAGRVRSYRIEKRHVNVSGDTLWVTLSVSLVRDGNGHPLHFIVQVEDISGRKLMEERLRRLAEYDPLTGVRNRRQFEHDLALALRACRRRGEQAALLMIDLDGFKAVNDTYGHNVGDDVLRAVASAIRKRLRETDIVARLGGDEFVVLLPHDSAAKAASVAEDLRRCLAAVTVDAGGTPVTIGASIGVAHIDQDTAGREAALAAADRAMYAHKRPSGRFVSGSDTVAGAAASSLTGAR